MLVESLFSAYFAGQITHLYTYNDKRNLILESRFVNDTLVSNTTYKYDTHFNIIKKIVSYKKTKRQSKHTEKYTAKYKYDSVGNWIRKTEYTSSINNGQYSTTERQIDCY